VTDEWANDGANPRVPMNQATRTILDIDESTYWMGYNSDGEIGPIFDAVAGKMEDSDTEDERFAGNIATPGVAQNAVEQLSLHDGLKKDPILTEDVMRQITNAQLKAELEKRKKSKSGNKAVLVLCHIAAINNPEPAAVNASGNAAPTEPNHASKDSKAYDTSA
jgi:hypothetical protein